RHRGAARAGHRRHRRRRPRHRPARRPGRRPDARPDRGGPRPGRPADPGPRRGPAPADPRRGVPAAHRRRARPAGRGGGQRMTTLTPTAPRTAGARLRWALVDAWTVAGRDLAHWARQPGLVLVNLLFPVLMLVMFGYLLGGAMDLGGADYREFLLPGMFTMTVAFVVEATMTAVAADVERGVL